MNQGGFIPSHEAGIYGLAEGGRTGFYRGSDRHAGTGSSASKSPGHPSGMLVPQVLQKILQVAIRVLITDTQDLM